MDILGFIMNNWLTIILSIAALAVFIVKVVQFVRSPSDKQIENLKEWLKLAVTEAEAALGSGTGQLKLRDVYDMAVEKFPWVGEFITFETFSTWVDEALEWMNNQLESNEKVKAYVIDGTITPTKTE